MGAFANQSERKTLSKSLFGSELRSGKAWSVFALRVVIGFYFLYAGYEKIETELGGRFATSGYLSHVRGPLATFFQSMAGNPAVEYLLVWGEFLVGVSLLFGILTRVGGVSGVAISALLYLSQLPVTNNPFVNQYFILIMVFLAFVFLESGRFLGLDGILQNLGFVERRPILRKIAKALG